MNKKADFSWQQLMIVLLVIALVLFALMWSTDLGTIIKDLISEAVDKLF